MQMSLKRRRRRQVREFLPDPSVQTLQQLPILTMSLHAQQILLPASLASCSSSNKGLCKGSPAAGYLLRYLPDSITFTSHLFDDTHSDHPTQCYKTLSLNFWSLSMLNLLSTKWHTELFTSYSIQLCIRFIVGLSPPSECKLEMAGIQSSFIHLYPWHLKKYLAFVR